MRVVSKETAKREFKEMTGRELCTKTRSPVDRKKQLEDITPNLETLSQGEVVFSEIRRKVARPVQQLRSHLPDGFKIRSKTKNDKKRYVAVFRKPESRDVAAEIRQKLREEWGGLS